MYWNRTAYIADEANKLLNSNIRCIEMTEYTNIWNMIYSWIVTLDVLK